MLAEVAEANAQDVDDAVKAAREGVREVLVEAAPAERAKYIFRIARALQEKARELAIVESMDGGKPIKESRDVDVPLAAAHFFYYAGWADKLEYAFPGRARARSASPGRSSRGTSRCSWRRGRSRPRSRAATPSSSSPPRRRRSPRCCSRKIIEEAELPPGVVNIVTGAGETGAALVESPGRRQGRVHRLDRRRQGDPARARGHDEARSRSSSAARRRTSSSPTRRSIRRSRASSTASTSTRATSAARARGCSSRRRPRAARRASSSDRMATLRLGDPLDKNTDVGAINSKMQLERIAELVAAGEEEGARALPAAVPAPREGLLVRADVLHRRRAELTASRGRRSSGRCSRVLTFRTPGRGDREGEQHDVRPLRRHLDGQGLEDLLDGRAAAGRRRLGQHVQQVRPDARRSAGTRRAASAAKAAARASRRT